MSANIRTTSDNQHQESSPSAQIQYNRGSPIINLEGPEIFFGMRHGTHASSHYNYSTTTIIWKPQLIFTFTCMDHFSPVLCHIGCLKIADRQGTTRCELVDLLFSNILYFNFCDAKTFILLFKYVLNSELLIEHFYIAVLVLLLK